ncbi:type I-E CRISPR-associated protein Cas6/Cse3/CasE [Bifidobacterium sp. MA2]|uniref:Type I-E CRISPR-associated protein Cas6/Cse3/CasE n=1 Tax=Bifidobacterium santillanense TaxID=2809028 RepID=A0ABS5UNB2_9BIFI|nr:type I-E CRISPR-associated protein Cas6/Cse3/CasE [Bifidobacterium santillanense]MBT1172410.1 type I-E CRISPR-associated protein Cas6/Cse3/CasE [Bifidobacterium santillanense]
MTEFTRVVVDSRNRHAIRAMSSLERMHAIIARSLGQGAEQGMPRALWRLDAGRRGRACRLYVVASTVPDGLVLAEELGVRPSDDIATCDYEPFLGRLECGQEWGFRLKANPTRSVPSKDASARGKREGILDIEKQKEWLFRQSRRAGFHMPINRLEMPEVMVGESRQTSFRRGESTVTLASATFDGVLVVDDPVLLRRALVQGIGRAKGYGFGLMTLLPLPASPRPTGDGA